MGRFAAVLTLLLFMAGTTVTFACGGGGGGGGHAKNGNGDNNGKQGSGNQGQNDNSMGDPKSDRAEAPPDAPRLPNILDGNPSLGIVVENKSCQVTFNSCTDAKEDGKDVGTYSGNTALHCAKGAQGLSPKGKGVAGVIEFTTVPGAFGQAKMKAEVRSPETGEDVALFVVKGPACAENKNIPIIPLSPTDVFDGQAFLGLRMRERGLFDSELKGERMMPVPNGKMLLNQKKIATENLGGLIASGDSGGGAFKQLSEGSPGVDAATNPHRLVQLGVISVGTPDGRLGGLEGVGWLRRQITPDLRLGSTPSNPNIIRGASL